MSWIKSMFRDSNDGSVSSKRVITFLAFVLCGVSFVADQFTGYPANKTLFESMIYLVIAGLGFTVTEKFSKKEAPNE